MWAPRLIDWPPEFKLNCSVIVVVRRTKELCSVIGRKRNWFTLNSRGILMIICNLIWVLESLENCLLLKRAKNVKISLYPLTRSPSLTSRSLSTLEARREATDWNHWTSASLCQRAFFFSGSSPDQFIEISEFINHDSSFVCFVIRSNLFTSAIHTFWYIRDGL